MRDRIKQLTGFSMIGIRIVK